MRRTYRGRNQRGARPSAEAIETIRLHHRRDEHRHAGVVCDGETHELLDAGVTHAISVDASTSYLGAARGESRRRGHEGRVTYPHGDFVDLADSVPSAEIVTLEREALLRRGR